MQRQIRKFADARDGDLNGIKPKDLIGRAIAEVAPSLLLTSISETTAFLLGAISTMPAVRTFSLYAGVAVFFNFLLQISVFLAALSLDARRQLVGLQITPYHLPPQGYFFAPPKDSSKGYLRFNFGPKVSLLTACFEPIIWKGGEFLS